MTVSTAILCVAFAAVANAATYPQTTEIDLVFPRNATYAPTDMLPIVIAVQDPTLAAVLQPYFDIEVWHYRTNRQPASGPLITFPTVNSSQSEPLFLYSYVANLTAGSYKIDLGVTIGNCSDNASVSTPTTYNDTGFGLVFTIADGGQAVDLVSASASDVCANASDWSLTWNVTATPKATTGVLTGGISTCAVLSEEKPWPVANPCGATVDKAAAASILATLESWTCATNCTSSDKKSTASDLQEALQTWDNGTCLPYIASESFRTTASFTSSLLSNDTSNSTLNSRAAPYHRNGRSSQLVARDDCTAIKVVSGDSCWALSQRCGISAADFTRYNPEANLCATLTPGQHVCCSAGTLPDFKPKPNANGTCATYTVVADDSCSAIGAAYGLTNDDIEGFNTNTWGWNGCSLLYVGANICLSSGDPPMPAALANALCGPQKPGTTVPTSGTHNLSSLNPCPLNACCDVWGQCGITKEFCTDTNTGAPGTAMSGTNGCISNCGTDIVQGSAPAQFIKLQYYEAFGMDRDCLYQDLSQLNLSEMTHIHFSFASMDSDYQISVGTSEYDKYEFNSFTRLGDSVHKVLTIGGWAFSTGLSTYQIFRDGVKSENREAMAKSIVSFVTDNNLDGIDLDWEYPGEPDIPGIPAGSNDEGDNYLEFLKVLKNMMPSGKTVSIAAPASYWYLKAFPIKDISDVIDYIVFMTYDLHGQPHQPDRDDDVLGYGDQGRRALHQDAFVDTFAPIPPDNTQNILNLILAFVGLAGTVGVSSLFNSVLKSLPYFTTDFGMVAFDNYKDISLALVSFGVSASGDYIQANQAKWTAESQDSFKAFMGDTMAAWQDSTVNTLKVLFNGEPDSLSLLQSVIANGHFIAGGDPETHILSYPGYTIDDDDASYMRGNVTRSYYAYMIPSIWSAVGDNVFVLDTQKGCDADRSTVYLPDDAATYCYDGTMYGIVYPHGYAQSCSSSETGSVCTKKAFSNPSGIDSLDGTQWGGVTVEDLVVGSVRTYMQNNNQNGGRTADPSDPGSLEDLMNGDITMPSVFTVPAARLEPRAIWTAMATSARRTWSGASTKQKAGMPSAMYIF